MRKATKPVRMLCTYRPKKGKEEVMAIWKPMMPILAGMELAIIEPVRGIA